LHGALCFCARGCTRTKLHRCTRLSTIFITQRAIGYSKVKVKLSLCLTKYHAVKVYEGVVVQLHAFLTSAVDGDEWSASRPGRFTLGERTSGTHFIGGWASPRAGLDAVMKRKIPSPHRESNSNLPARSLVTIPTELLRLVFVTVLQRLRVLPVVNNNLICDVTD
jgi:hypothetical protein